VDLVVQASVVQAIIWLTLLLFVLEFRRTGIEGTITTLKPKASSVSNVMINEGEDQSKDVEANNIVEYTSTRLPFIELMKRVWLKFIVNPNSYGCVIGISWAFISNRYTIIFLNFFFELILFYYICLHLASLINFFAPDFLFTLPLV
jgi:auxin efflux carrier family